MEIPSLTSPDEEKTLEPSAQAPASAPAPNFEKARKKPERFDFRHPAFLPPAEMRNLRKHHADFIEALASSLANYLRVEVQFATVQFRTVPYRDFAQSVRPPAHLTLLKVEPLRGICIVDIPPRLGLTIVERLLGGPGGEVESRELSEIETALVDQVIQLLVTEWCNTWQKGREVKPLVLAHENTGQFLQSSAPETTMLVLEIGTRLGECTEQIQVLFPWPMIEPLLEELEPKLIPETPAQLRDSGASKWRSEFAEIPMHLTVQGPVFEIPARDLARLKPGDLLDLDPQFVNHISIQVGNVAKFTGRLGTAGQKWAVEITAIQNIV
jgi:flagellar motor switch protein FliM